MALSSPTEETSGDMDCPMPLSSPTEETSGDMESPMSRASPVEETSVELEPTSKKRRRKSRSPPRKRLRTTKRSKSSHPGAGREDSPQRLKRRKPEIRYWINWNADEIISKWNTDALTSIQAVAFTRHHI
jgi:hypothetical protein